jgi:hypothetical protein
MVPKRVAALVRENTQAQNELARQRRREQKVRSCSGGYSHNIYSLGGFRCHRKSIALHSTALVLATKIDGSRKTKVHGEREEHIQSEGANERERAKHSGNPNVDQQGNRANVRPIRPDRQSSRTIEHERAPSLTPHS